MAVEIGTLVVKGAFGAADGAQAPGVSEQRLAQVQREILDAVREMLAETERRAQER